MIENESPIMKRHMKRKTGKRQHRGIKTKYQSISICDFSEKIYDHTLWSGQQKTIGYICDYFQKSKFVPVESIPVDLQGHTRKHRWMKALFQRRPT